MRKFTVLVLVWLLTSCGEGFMLDGTWKGVDGDNNEWIFDLKRNGSRVVGTFGVHWFDTDVEEQLSGWYYDFKTVSVILHLEFEYENTDVECEFSGYPTGDDTIDGYLTCSSDEPVGGLRDTMNINRS